MKGESPLKNPVGDPTMIYNNKFEALEFRK